MPKYRGVSIFDNSHYSELCFAWQQAVQLLPLLQVAVSWGPHVPVHCIAVDIRLLLVILRAARDVIIQLADICHV